MLSKKTGLFKKMLNSDNSLRNKRLSESINYLKKMLDLNRWAQFRYNSAVYLSKTF